MRSFFCSIVGASAIWMLAACQHPTSGPSIGVGNPYPVSSYVCDGTRLAVRLMGESASVSVDGAAAVGYERHLGSSNSSSAQCGVPGCIWTPPTHRPRLVRSNQ